MGAGMARSLLRAGMPVDVWNRSPERCADLAAAGAVAHSDPASAVAHAAVVITILSDAAATSSTAAPVPAALRQFILVRAAMRGRPFLALGSGRP